MELLADCARGARRQADRTFFALWLAEAAHGWLNEAAPPSLHSQIEENLGGLLALVGDIGDGIGLIGAASRRLFQFAGATQDRAALPTAWLLRYEAAPVGSRTRATPRAEVIAELKKIRAEAPEASEAWFHAGFELIFASASPPLRQPTWPTPNNSFVG